jgi:MFS superfamily sulfate permease-like transporter
VAGVMALISGAILIVGGLARLGFVTEFLSKPIRYGYMNGIAHEVRAQGRQVAGLERVPAHQGGERESFGPQAAVVTSVSGLESACRIA